MAALEPATKNRVNLLDKILSKDNLNAAYFQFKRKKGAAGVDGMEVDEMLGLLKANKARFLASLRNGKYKPNQCGGWKSRSQMAVRGSWEYQRCWTGSYSRPQRRCYSQSSKRYFPKTAMASDREEMRTRR